MIHRTTVEDKSKQTIKSYVRAVERLVRFHDLTHPRKMEIDEVLDYLVSLNEYQQVNWCTNKCMWLVWDITGLKIWMIKNFVLRLTHPHRMMRFPHYVVTFSHFILSLCWDHSVIYLFSIKKLMYGLLMRAVKDTLFAFSYDPKLINGKNGGINVLHTSTQQLTYHPHVHCILSAGSVTKIEKWK